MAKKSLNSSTLARGIARAGKKSEYGTDAVSKKSKAGKAKAAEATVKTFQKGKRTVPAQKAPLYYPADDVPSKRVRNFTPKSAKLRASIKPGSVLVLLAGRHRGKRVVFLKQLASGLLLVTGPFKINGVPLRRVNQAYVLATKTQVSLDSVKVEDALNDTFFAQPKSANKKKGEKEFFEDGKDKKHVVDDARKTHQKKVDEALLKNIAKVPQLSAYLGAKFSLTNGQYPHKMQF